MVEEIIAEAQPQDVSRVSAARELFIANKTKLPSPFIGTVEKEDASISPHSPGFSVSVLLTKNEFQKRCPFMHHPRSFEGMVP